MDKIMELKAEVFDLIKKQEELQAEFQRLEQIKRQKVMEIQKLEAESKK